MGLFQENVTTLVKGFNKDYEINENYYLIQLFGELHVFLFIK